MRGAAWCGNLVWAECGLLAIVGHHAELSGTRDSQSGSFLGTTTRSSGSDAFFVSVLCGVTHGFVIAAFAVSASMYNHEPLSLVSVALGPRERAFTCGSGSDSHDINEAVIAAQRY